MSINEETDIFLMHHDLLSLIKASLECYKSGAYRHAGEFIKVDQKKERAILSANGCVYPERLVDGETLFSKASTENWPSEWRLAVRHDDIDCEHETVVTIEGYLSNRIRSVVNGRIVAIKGMESGYSLEVRDDTGAMMVWCAADTYGAREIQIDGFYGITVVPVEEGQARADLGVHHDSVACGIIRLH